ncbi:Ribosomal RNA large subunit methyltransferase N [Candidatus Arthromitus sp. SFB-mouse-NL]|uniref:23S rRNA (adenine(2503)-C(2))-methyltransferase RlmN n=1 Tax=Candidatus Arthromitus sp. SFB-mouse-NL TaxID=1508644 RepID=UPI00049A5452|nr:23S rRNA (adenine(2503)-C(2))-methyltransferase RlmN [Candidatus Arthromitus sp. SFB-mouse-NL]AID44550.1 Ribosomal RNA large subunit methyltransferase N [Candidatus Arthromitus sp. SFB-mouse-NL]
MFNVLNFKSDELRKYLEENKFRGFKANQIIDWIYNKKIFDFDDMTNLSNIERKQFKDILKIELPLIEKVQKSIDGTIKFLLKLVDGNLIECVFMVYDYGNTICISTQVGCAMGCKFCASTVNGFLRNLELCELMGQVLVVERYTSKKINRIVLMGTGEPLYNYENIITFIREMRSKMGMSSRHITLSTCGIVPKIYDLANEGLSINLAISLHAINDDKRKTIMPIANKYSINQLIDACLNYFDKTKRRISFEYLLIDGVNDSDDDVRELVSLCKKSKAHVNLIPVNEINENDFKESRRLKKFYNYLLDSGVNVTMRQKKGVDIDAACGQLRLSYSK